MRTNIRKKKEKTKITVYYNNKKYFIGILIIYTLYLPQINHTCVRIILNKPNEIQSVF